MEDRGGRSHLGGLGVGDRVIVKCILDMWRARLRAGSMWLWICANMGLYEHSNEPFLSIEDGEFCNQLIVSCGTSTLLHGVVNPNLYRSGECNMAPEANLLPSAISAST